MYSELSLSDHSMFTFVCFVINYFILLIFILLSTSKETQRELI